jgi:hypothetical protein
MIARNECRFLPTRNKGYFDQLQAPNVGLPAADPLQALANDRNPAVQFPCAGR